MALIKLRYFDIKGLGEAIRMLLVYTNTPFTDERIEATMEEWLKIKSAQKFHQLPVLELADGRVLTQSTAIIMFLAEPHGLVPSDPWLRAQAMEMALHWLDYQSKQQVMIATTDKQKRDELFHQNIKILYEPKMQFLDETLKKSKSGFIQDQLCFADFVTYVMMFAYKHIFKRDPAQEYVSIKQFMKQVSELPRVKEWIPAHAAKIYTPYISPIDMD